ncbi:MAG: hypothetical protein MI923_20265 [Phycisphaerales bacterium]|nr:hypothetical protein [Phycisphaerales bacterium]
MSVQSNPNLREKIKIGAAVVMLLAAAVIGYSALTDGESEAIASELLEDRSCEVACQSCHEKYSIPLKEYLEKCDSREDKAKGILCAKCGQDSAWLGEPPIEYSNRKWNAGWVGRDILKSNLKAYHAANPEPAGKGIGVEEYSSRD